MRILSSLGLAGLGLGGALLLAQCGTTPPSNFGDDGGTDGGLVDDAPSLDDVIFGGDTTGPGDCGGKAPTCSGDMHSLVDCHGNVVQKCSDTQGCAGGQCIAACDAAVANKSSVGCEYYAHNPLMIFGKGCFALYVANTWTSGVTISADAKGNKIDLSKYAYLPTGSGPTLKLTALGQNGQIPPGKVAIVFLRDGNGGLGTNCGEPAAETDTNASAWTDPVSGTNASGQALHVVASAPVVVYDILPYGGGRSEVTDATLLLPTSTWDKNYIAITPRPLGNNTLSPAIAIVASDDSTNVTIRPTADITAGTGVAAATKGQPQTYALNKGQVLRIEQQADLLGSVVSADKPVGVWGEQQCINIDALACDGAHEQIPPVRALGSEYVYGRYRNRDPNIDETPPTRITGAVDGTQLTWDPSPTGAQPTVNEGESFEVRSSGPFVVKSQDDKHPFYVATYMTGGAAFSNRGDPEFVNVVPAAQYLSRYVFFTNPTYPETNLVYIRKKAQDDTFKDVTLDCAGVIGGWKPVGSGGEYEYTTADIATGNFKGVGNCDNGAHESHSDGPFGLTVWGWGTEVTGGSGTAQYSEYVSYAYPAGASVQSINTVVVPPTPK